MHVIPMRRLLLPLALLAASSAQAGVADRASTTLPSAFASLAFTAPMGNELGAPRRESSGGSRMGREEGGTETPAPAPDAATAQDGRSDTVTAKPRVGAGDEPPPPPRRTRPTGWRGTLPSGVI